MSKIIRFGASRWASQAVPKSNHIQFRNFLSNAYYCNEVWDARLSSPILQKINFDTFYYDLDANYQKKKTISAIDVDIYANSVVDDSHTDEILDLLFKLRQTADTGNMLDSTSHAVFRLLSRNNHYDKFLHVLDNRLNYGVFLDPYTANLLFDTFWKMKDYASGARIAGQLMLQEDFSHPLTLYFSLLHCFKYLQKPEGWPQQPAVEDSEEEVKVRVKYIKNPYFDDHFDLKDPNHIVGKTLWLAGRSIKDALGLSFQITGLALHEKFDAAKSLIESNKQSSVLRRIIDLIPEENEIKQAVSVLKMQDDDVEKLLTEKMMELEQQCSEKDIADQCKLFQTWETQRADALEDQKYRLLKAQRMAAIEEAKTKLQEREKKLWFFDKEEQIELDIEANAAVPTTPRNNKKQPIKEEEEYIPPEIKVTYNR